MLSFIHILAKLHIHCEDQKWIGVFAMTTGHFNPLIIKSRRICFCSFKFVVLLMNMCSSKSTLPGHSLGTSHTTPHTTVAVGVGHSLVLLYMLSTS